MSVYSHMHFCLGAKVTPKIESSAHPDLVDTIDVTMKVGDASVTVSGSTDAVYAALWELLSAALRVRPLTKAAAEVARVSP